MLTEAGPDSASDRESDSEVITSESFRGSMKEGESIGEYGKRHDRIFKYITVQDKSVTIPDLQNDDNDKLTLYIELDDVLLHTFICDENFGYMANPASKEPEF